MPTISGVVKDFSETPCDRVVRVYRCDTGAFVSQVVSNATTGVWSVTTNDTSPHFAVEHHGTPNASFSPIAFGLHMEGPDASTEFVDVAGNAVTAVGDAKLVTSGTQFSFGASCGLFDGTGDRLDFSGGNVLNFGANKFTISGRVRPASIGSVQIILDGRGIVNDLACGLIVGINAAGKLYFNASSAHAGQNGSWGVSLVGTETMVSGTDYHFEVSRDDGNVWRTFLSGSQQATTTSSLTVGNPASVCYVGAGCNGAGSIGYYLNARLKDILVEKNVCRHSANFTPPSTAFAGAFSGSAENALIYDNLTPV